MQQMLSLIQQKLHACRFYFCSYDFLQQTKEIKITNMRGLFLLVAMTFSVLISAQRKTSLQIEKRVDALMAQMTLEEKIGQLNQYSADWEVTGPETKDNNKANEIRKGWVGSMLNVRGAEQTREMQKLALQSRLKIPFLFGMDVIHGYRVTFPIPLAEAASWDMDIIEKSARIAATEAAAGGVHWTFAPMVDISVDPRWGRVMEGAGEDPYLGSKIAAARVKGFQGKGLGNTDAVMACVKHFVGYGAAVGGRDYNSVDMSMRNLWQNYLPPFKAALDAGAATFMNSFNDLNGTPATAHHYLLRDILKDKWNFQGFVVSDWGSVYEMVNHRYAKDRSEAAMQAINAGTDMDMEGRCYVGNLAELVKLGKVKIEVVDDAVRRVLRKKFELGLFDDPFKFSNADREKNILNAPQYYQASRDVAKKSIVLLKNENDILPLTNQYKKIALIGPLAKAADDMKGAWSVGWNGTDTPVSLYEGIQNVAKENKFELLYAKGCEIYNESKKMFEEAVAIAKQADVVVMAMGESAWMSGESKSRANIELPGVQEDLIKAIAATGKPIVVLMMSGRPLVFEWVSENIPAIAYTWWLGSEAGNAIVDVLFGKYNPSGKLPMTFPRNVGQIPVYYNYLSTGRPSEYDKTSGYTVGYIDIPYSPQYAFGHGLSYTTFEYSDLKISKEKFIANEKITISMLLKNTGKYAGEEVVQLYIQDIISQPVRPVKELKGFHKINLNPGESKLLFFVIDRESLSFYNDKLDFILQPGEFKCMIGSSSADLRLEGKFEVLNE